MIALRTTTKRNIWTQAWAESAAEPQGQLILALMLINGLSGDEGYTGQYFEAETRRV